MRFAFSFFTLLAVFFRAVLNLRPGRLVRLWGNPTLPQVNECFHFERNPPFLSHLQTCYGRVRFASSLIEELPMRRTTLLPLLAFVLLPACSGKETDPRGLVRGETLLSVSATGESETKPDEARFSAGVSSIGATAKDATEANNKIMNKVIAALEALGVKREDLQTQSLNVARIDWGRNKGRFEATNQVQVRMRNAEKVGEAVLATTQAGANVLSGPTLRISDIEMARRGAYIAAYKAAKTRAEAYAEAAGLKIARVLTIRDGGQSMPGPMPYGIEADAMAEATAPPPAPISAAPPVLAGQTTSTVSVSVDFALAAR